MNDENRSPLVDLYGEVLKSHGYREKPGDEHVFVKPCSVGEMFVHLKNEKFCDVGLVIIDPEGRPVPRDFKDNVGKDMLIPAFIASERVYLALIDSYYAPLRHPKIFTN